MGIVDRVKNILLTPKTEWEVIAAEPTQPKDLVTGYILPLAAVAAVAGLIGSAVIGTSFLGATYRMPIVWALVGAVLHLVMSVLFTFVVAFIVDALAPSFGAQKNFNQAFKVVAYSATAGWVGSVFGIIPYLGGLIALLFGLYCLYLLYLGLPRLMKGPADKAIGYTVVVVLSAIVVGAFLFFAIGLVTAPAMIAAGTYGSAAPRVTYDKDSKLGKLEEFARKMEEAGKKVEAAEKSGDAKKQMEAAMAVLGTAVSGGKRVEPMQIDQLKPFLPGTFAGMPQTATQSERSGVAGLMTAKVEANYGDASGKNAELEVVDTGGAAGLMGLASWIGVQGEREDANRRESTRKEGSRMIHEEVDKRGGRNKYTVVVADRFVVSAEANGVDIKALKSAVNGLDLAKLDAIK